MSKQTSKAQLLEDIRTERRRLEKSLSALKAEDLLLPGVTGAWSVKDLLAHLAAWERLFLEWYFTGLHGGTSAAEPVGMSKYAIDALNQQTYEKNRLRRLDDIMAEFHASYQQMIATVEGIPEEDMFAHGRFGWTGKYTLADYIAGNTCNHYAWAKSQIMRWTKHAAAENENR